MKLNRKWLMVIALVMSLTMATAGTIAYLIDQDADKNTMTLGKVEIVQNEHQRAKDEYGDYKTDTIDGKESYVLEAFENDKPLLPTTELKADGTPDNHGAGPYDDTTVIMSQIGSYGSVQVFKSPNAQDKIVTVTNTGRTDAYVRTIIAFEVGTATENLPNRSARYTDKNDDLSAPWFGTKLGNVEIDGNTYVVYEYVYHGAKLSDGTIRHENGILPAGDTSYPSLMQVYLPAKATNEDVEKLDGNNNGKYDVLVLSQAVQADGFDDAATALKAGFGEVNAENVQKWFSEMVIGSPGEKNETNDVPLVKPFAKVTTLGENTTLTNKNGDVTVLEKNRTIDTTNSSMGYDVGKIPLDVAYQFEPTMTYEEGQDSEYADWHADFVVSVNKDIPAYSIGLAGYYDAWCSLNDDKWVLLASPDPITAGTEIRLVETMGNGSITVSYEELCNYGNDGIGFLCGAVEMNGTDKTINGQTPAALPAGTVLTVELRLYEATGGSASTETGEYITTGTYTYTFN